LTDQNIENIFDKPSRTIQSVVKDMDGADGFKENVSSPTR